MYTVLENQTPETFRHNFKKTALIIIIIIIMKAKIIVTLYIKNVTGALYTVNYMLVRWICMFYDAIKLQRHKTVLYT